MGDQYPPYLAYTNLPAFLRHRGLEPEEKLEPGLEGQRDKVVARLMRFGYYQVSARRPDTGAAGRTLVVILLLDPDHKYAHHSKDLRGLVAAQALGARRARLHEVIVVAPERVLEKKHLTAVFRELRAAGAAPPYYNLYPYYVFSAPIPEAANVPRHRLMSAPEARAHLRRERLVGERLPELLASDPPAVWLGARPGDYVEIERPSETAGLAFAVRRVVEGDV